MWELDCEESWALKNRFYWTVVLEKTLENPLDFKEIQPVHLKEISPGFSLEELVLRLKLQYLATHEKSWLIGKDPDAGRDLGQEEKGTTDNEILDGSPTRWTWVWVNSWRSGGLGGLPCWDSWGRKKSDTTEQRNGTQGPDKSLKKKWLIKLFGCETIPMCDII